jgi:hypothetical protein
MRRAALALLLATACGPSRGNFLEVAQLSVEGGLGCAPTVDPNTVPRAFVQDGAQVRLGMRFVDPWTREPVEGLAGRQLEVFLATDDGRFVEGSAPVASGVVNGTGLGVVDWRPSAGPIQRGEVAEISLIVRPEGFDPSPSLHAEVLRPLDDAGQILCAYVANATGQRISGVGNGGGVTFIAEETGLPSDAVFSFDVTGDERFEGTADASGRVAVPGRVLLPSSAFDAAGNRFHRFQVAATSAAEPASSWGRWIAIHVAR